MDSHCTLQFHACYWDTWNSVMDWWETDSSKSCRCCSSTVLMFRVDRLEVEAAWSNCGIWKVGLVGGVWVTEGMPLGGRYEALRRVGHFSWAVLGFFPCLLAHQVMVPVFLIHDGQLSETRLWDHPILKCDAPNCKLRWFLLFPRNFSLVLNSK